jgi:hypothetical protein
MTMPSDVMQPPQNDPSRGTVCAGGVDTVYQHAGRGAPLIFFGPPQTPFREALLTRLSQRYRVIAPDLEHPASVATFSIWLREFLQALTPRAAILVASEAWIAQLLSFTVLEPEFTARLVLLLDAPAAMDCPDPIDERLANAGVPVLLTWVHLDNPQAALESIEQYLDS